VSIPLSLVEALQDRYVLERELGRGGMATVYLARDLKHKRHIALKLLDPEVGAILGAERFSREIETAAQLQHPHILPVHDSGEAAGRLWYTMPFVEGESLRDRLQREGRLGLEDAVQVGWDIASALDYAHRRGVIHRDIKPENVLLSDGQALVADFGIARSTRLEAGQSLTATGLSLGTPAYMSPEQALGERNLDGRSDIYALGCLLFELLIGVPPFTGLSAQAVISKHIANPVPSLRTVRPELPLAIDKVVAGAMAKSPDDRFATAAEFASALTGALEERATVTGNVTTANVQRTRRTPILLAGGGILLLGGAALALWSRQEPATPGARSTRLAVLPFENVGDSATSYFADGVTDAIRDKLAAVPGLEVIASTSSTPYRATSKPPRQIGRELAVQYLLVGKVRWAKPAGGADRVQVRPELVDVNTGVQRWGEPFDAAFTDVFEVQADIARRVAGTLDVALTDSTQVKLAATPTTNSAAYDAYLQGWGLLKRGDPESQRAASAMFGRAIALDSNFALAHFYRGVAEYNVWSTGAERTLERRAQATAELETGARLGPDLPETGMYRAWDFAEKGQFDRAAEQFRRVFQRWPNNADALGGLSRFEQRLGKWREALAHAKRAAELKPLEGLAHLEVASILWMLRDYSEARQAIERAVLLSPDATDPHWFRISIVGTLGGRPDSAGIFLRQAVDQLGVGRMGYLALAQGRFVDPELRSRLLALPPESLHVDSVDYFINKGWLWGLAGNSVKERSLADSGLRLLTRQGALRSSEADEHLKLANAFMNLKRNPEAVREAARAIELMPITKNAYDGAHVAASAAMIYALAGEADLALKQLEHLLSVPSPISVPSLKQSIVWQSLRNNPRFKRLLADST
jgi:serine/threonine protein kinase/tetratricopeptide (TPR) repeat protein